MSDVKWNLQAREFVQCNCDFGCPCQFSAPPSHGDCHAIAVFDIEKGRYGDIKLDGLKFGMAVAWPGAIHEGRGKAVPFVDERANEKQREALLRILSGQDTEPGATLFQVFSTTLDTVHDPVFAPVRVDIDVDGRLAKLEVPGLIESRGEPILNPVTGEKHRARINLPQGFEYDTCEVGRGWTEVEGVMPMSFGDSHAHFAELHMTQSGVTDHA